MRLQNFIPLGVLLFAYQSSAVSIKVVPAGPLPIDPQYPGQGIQLTLPSYVYTNDILGKPAGLHWGYGTKYPGILFNFKVIEYGTSGMLTLSKTKRKSHFPNKYEKTPTYLSVHENKYGNEIMEEAPYYNKDPNMKELLFIADKGEDLALVNGATHKLILDPKMKKKQISPDIFHACASKGGKSKEDERKWGIYINPPNRESTKKEQLCIDIKMFLIPTLQPINVREEAALAVKGVTERIRSKKIHTASKQDHTELYRLLSANLDGKRPSAINPNKLITPGDSATTMDTEERKPKNRATWKDMDMNYFNQENEESSKLVDTIFSGYYKSEGENNIKENIYSNMSDEEGEEFGEVDEEDDDKNEGLLRAPAYSEEVHGFNLPVKKVKGASKNTKAVQNWLQRKPSRRVSGVKMQGL